MGRSRLGGRKFGVGWDGWRALLALSASVALGIAASVFGCGSDYQPPLNGGSKGPEMNRAMAHGPGSASASQMSQTQPTTRAQIPPSPMLSACAEGKACVGADGCDSGCDPSSRQITFCATCDNTGFADCTQSACTP